MYICVLPLPRVTHIFYRTGLDFELYISEEIKTTFSWFTTATYVALNKGIWKIEEMWIYFGENIVVAESN